jgi:hypothetical protein
MTRLKAESLAEPSAEVWPEASLGDACRVWRQVHIREQGRAVRVQPGDDRDLERRCHACQAYSARRREAAEFMHGI